MKKLFLKHFVPFVAVIALICGLCSFGVTYAYLTAGDRTENIFTVGETEGESFEEFPQPSPSPGETSKKEVSVLNTGNLPAFVRVRLVFSDEISRLLTDIEGLDNGLWSYDTETDFYYYSGGVINPGEQTPDLMTGVTFKLEGGVYTYDDLTNFDLSVYSELIQHYDHEGDCSDTEYIDVWSR